MTGTYGETPLSHTHRSLLLRWFPGSHSYQSASILAAFGSVSVDGLPLESCGPARRLFPLARVGPTTPKRATARGSKRPPGASRSEFTPASNDGCDQSDRGTPPRDRNEEADPCLLGSPVGRDKGRNAYLERRFGSRHDDRRQL